MTIDESDNDEDEEDDNEDEEDDNENGGGMEPSYPFVHPSLSPDNMQSSAITFGVKLHIKGARGSRIYSFEYDSPRLLENNMYILNSDLVDYLISKQVIEERVKAGHPNLTCKLEHMTNSVERSEATTVCEGITTLNRMVVGLIGKSAISYMLDNADDFLNFIGSTKGALGENRDTPRTHSVQIANFNLPLIEGEIKPAVEELDVFMKLILEVPSMLIVGGKVYELGLKKTKPTSLEDVTREITRTVKDIYEHQYSVKKKVLEDRLAKFNYTMEATRKNAFLDGLKASDVIKKHGWKISGNPLMLLYNKKIVVKRITYNNDTYSTEGLDKEIFVANIAIPFDTKVVKAYSTKESFHPNVQDEKQPLGYVICLGDLVGANLMDFIVQAPTMLQTANMDSAFPEKCKAFIEKFINSTKPGRVVDNSIWEVDDRGETVNRQHWDTDTA